MNAPASATQYASFFRVPNVRPNVGMSHSREQGRRAPGFLRPLRGSQNDWDQAARRRYRLHPWPVDEAISAGDAPPVGKVWKKDCAERPGKRGAG
ncbi:MAG: hypothetical protein V9G24_06510 [Rhodoblastus sp.]